MSTAPRKTLEQVKSSCSVLLGVTHGLLRDGAVTAAHLASHAQACAAAKSEFARVWALLQQSQPDAALLRSAAAASLAVDTAEAEVRDAQAPTRAQGLICRTPTAAAPGHRGGRHQLRHQRAAAGAGLA